MWLPWQQQQQQQIDVYNVYFITFNVKSRSQCKTVIITVIQNYCECNNHCQCETVTSAIWLDKLN